MKTVNYFYSILLVLIYCNHHKDIYPNNILIDNVSLYIPPKINIVKDTLHEDFDIYFFLDLGKNTILKLYVGNQPDFNAANKKVTYQKISGLKGQNVYCEDKYNQNYSREFLIDTKNDQWPQFYHFWYNANDLNASKIADSIINSFDLRKIK